MHSNLKTLNIAFLNCKGQSGFTVSKQLQIQNFLITNDVDILNLQETHVENDSFSACNVISSNYEIIKNNSNSKYGTCTLVRNTFEVQERILHQSGRIIIFSIGSLTLGNVYLPSGTDSDSRSARENFCGEIFIFEVFTQPAWHE